MYREIAGTDERVRAIPGVRDRRVRATKVRLYILHGWPDVTLQSTRHEVILTGLREKTSERQVISHDPFVTSTF